MAHEYVNATGSLVQTEQGLGLALFRYQGTLCVALIARTRSGVPDTIRFPNPGREFRVPLGYDTRAEVTKMRSAIDEAHRWMLRTTGKLPMGTLVDVMA
jgi:hypothetical protein